MVIIIKTELIPASAILGTHTASSVAASDGAFGLFLFLCLSWAHFYASICPFPKAEGGYFRALGNKTREAPWGLLVYLLEGAGCQLGNVRVGGTHGEPGSNFTYLQEGRCTCYHCRYVGYLLKEQERRAEGLLTAAPTTLASSLWTLLKAKNLSLSTSTLSSICLYGWK